jgi:hypothetical protein
LDLRRLELFESLQDDLRHAIRDQPRAKQIREPGLDVQVEFDAAAPLKIRIEPPEVDSHHHLSPGVAIHVDLEDIVVEIVESAEQLFDSVSLIGQGRGTGGRPVADPPTGGGSTQLSLA